MHRLFSLALALTLVGCNSKSESPTSDTPTANDEAPITESQLGINFYPRARIVTSEVTEQMVTANLETPDTVEKVLRFYEEQLGVARDTFGTIMAEKNGRVYAVSAVKKGANTAVSVMGKK